ncbi:MAG TPA: hypothetical protein DCS55_11435, partial [Acidimicrobiaceae bacterium]|nr:hypothetical protein [Acidimicrobiaceae bacterium]
MALTVPLEGPSGAVDGAEGRTTAIVGGRVGGRGAVGTSGIGKCAGRCGDVTLTQSCCSLAEGPGCGGAADGLGLGEALEPFGQIRLCSLVETLQRRSGRIELGSSRVPGLRTGQRCRRGAAFQSRHSRLPGQGLRRESGLQGGLGAIQQLTGLVEGAGLVEGGGERFELGDDGLGLGLGFQALGERLGVVGCCGDGGLVGRPLSAHIVLGVARDTTDEREGAECASCDEAARCHAQRQRPPQVRACGERLGPLVHQRGEGSMVRLDLHGGRDAV